MWDRIMTCNKQNMKKTMDLWMSQLAKMLMKRFYVHEWSAVDSAA